MIQPIVMTPKGDVLGMRAEDERVDSDVIRLKFLPIGRHVHCWGDCYIRPTSTTHHAIFCDQCFLRVPINIPPGPDITYRQLRKYFVELLSSSAL